MHLFNYRNQCKFDIYVEFWDIYHDIQHQANLHWFLAVSSVYYVHLCCGLIYLFTVVGAPPDDLHLYLQGSTRLDETICPQTQTALQETGGQKGT